MARLSVYHAEVFTREDGVLTVGVCATGPTDGAACVQDRLEDDGYTEVRVRHISRVAPQGSWKPGATLIY